jgi:hypothetical protein
MVPVDMFPYNVPALIASRKLFSRVSSISSDAHFMNVAVVVEF